MIAVIGDIILDKYIYGEATRLSPEAPVPVIKFKREETRSGGALNVFKNIKSLTDNVVMCTASDSPPIKTRIYSGNHYVARIDYEDQDHRWTTSDAALGADIIVVSDYNKGAVTLPLQFNKGTKTIVDPKRSLDCYKNSWCLKPNAVEFSAWSGPWSNITELFGLMLAAKRDLNVEHLIVTLGADGVAYCGTECVHFPSNATEVFDVTGAGDTFTATLAYAIDQGTSMIDAIKLANRASGVAVSHQGTYIIKPEDLDIGDVVFTNGCFDLLHQGHIEYLKASKQLGKKLIVGINSDRSVRELKGASRPINDQDTRKLILESLKFVDQVIIFDGATPLEIIKQIQPDIVTKGGDYVEKEVVGYGIAKVVIIPHTGHSTTNTINRIKQ